MIQKISLYFLLPMMVIALFLASLGVHHIEFGDTYYSFIQSVGQSFNQWKLEIPDIPKIPTINRTQGDSDSNFLKALVTIANFFVVVVNAIISIVNILISIVNIVVQLIQFILTLIYQCKDFIHRVSGDIRISYV